MRPRPVKPNPIRAVGPSLRNIWTPPMARREPALFALLVGFSWGILVASLIDRFA